MARSERDGRTTVTGMLARHGFTDPDRAGRLLAEHALAEVAEDPELLRALGAAPDPDLALSGLDRLLRATTAPAALCGALRADPALRSRLLGVLGHSAALAGHLARHAGDWRVLAGDAPSPAADSDGTDLAAALRAELLRSVGADAGRLAPRAIGAGADVRDALRVAYHRGLLRIAAADLTAAASVDEVAARLAELAGAALEAGLAMARAELPRDAERCRLAVIGMGKIGGHELNYASDVDVIFVAEPARDTNVDAAVRSANRLAASLIRACSETTAEGALWPVDAGLRPEGRGGPLARTLASHAAYYERWAQTWEFQALVKARPVAGDPEIGRRYVEAVTPMVWNAAERERFVTDVQAMRRRVEAHVPRAESQREVKLGPGGLRDVEFAVQLLQLVHGRSDETLRSPNTLAALDSLSAGGYVARGDAASLAEAYRFLRSLEHRLQLHRLRRTHVLPSHEGDLRRTGRALGLPGDPVAELTAAWRRHAREVRRLHEKLFYRPLLLAVARLPSEEVRLTPEAARARLEALGYADPAGALRHIAALTSGVSRRAAIQRTLLPAMLGWFADAADPDAGLLGFRKVSDALGTTSWYLRLLRDEGAAAERMAHVLASSRYVTDLLLRAPDAVAMLGDDSQLVPRSTETLRTEMLSAVRRHDDVEAGVSAVRGLRRRELVRVAVADLLGLLDVERVGRALTAVTVATLEAVLEAAARSARGPGATGSPRVRLALIGMGRLGGGEMDYASDADVMFVYQPAPDAEEAGGGRGPHAPAHDSGHASAHAIAEELRRLLAAPGPDPPLPVDAGLRPEGRDGPLVRTLSSYDAYYARWASTWERQALLRAAPVAGNRDLGERFVRVADPVRYPSGGLGDTAQREIRRLKARMEAERLPRSADTAMHTKLGRGGLSDVEWVAQLIQLRHAAAEPSLRTSGTLVTLYAAAECGLLDRRDADALAEAWRTATRVRGAVMLVRGRASDIVPEGVRERAGVARVLGYPPERAGELVEDYRRVTRRARAVVERVFFG